MSDKPQSTVKLIKADRTEVSHIWPIEIATCKNSPFEYDQGDVVCVDYDELYDLVQENLRLGRALLKARGGKI